MWLMNEAKGEERSLEGLTKRMLLVNFASLHSTCLVSNATHPFPRRNAFLITDAADARASILPARRQPRLRRTPSTRGRSCPSGGRLDESWNRQDVQDRQLHSGDATA